MAFISSQPYTPPIKIVYCGPALSGKATNLTFIHQTSGATKPIQLIAPEQIMLFETAPAWSKKNRLQLCTISGAVYYDAPRIIALKRVDGIIFVADSAPERQEANEEALGSLPFYLEENGLGLKDVPLVLQYNKRDLPGAASLEEMDAILREQPYPRFEAVAQRGIGILEPLQYLAKQILANRAQ